MSRLSAAVALPLAMVLAGTLWAAEKEEKKPAASPLKDLTVEGKLIKKEGKAEQGKAAPVKYAIVYADGCEVVMPKPKGDIDLEKFVDKQVKVVGKGTEREKDGKKTIRLVELVSIEEIAAPADDAPAEGTE